MKALKRFLWVLWTALYVILYILGIILFIPYWIITGRGYWNDIYKLMRIDFFEGMQPFE